MIKHWPVHEDYEVLFSFNKGRRVYSMCDIDFIGIELDERNDLHKDEYRLIGAYIISNWSDEE